MRRLRLSIFATLAASALAGLTLGGCKKTTPAAQQQTAAGGEAASKTDEKKADESKSDDAIAGKVVELTTSMGKIKIELDREKAPRSVQNFLRYVKDKHYDGTIFHRVISGFMVQGGGFTPDFNKKPTREPIENEADNGLLNTRGTVSMARTSAPHSATAQFFINVVDNGFLNHRGKTPRGWGYAVFGKVIEGMDVVDKIRNVPTGAKGPFGKDAPQTDVLIQSAKIIE